MTKRGPLDQDYENSESKFITEQSNPNILYEKTPYTTIVGDLTVEHLHEKSIPNKVSCNNLILVKLFQEACTKNHKTLSSSDLEKNLRRSYYTYWHQQP